MSNKVTQGFGLPGDSPPAVSRAKRPAPLLGSQASLRIMPFTNGSFNVSTGTRFSRMRNSSRLLKCVFFDLVCRTTLTARKSPFGCHTSEHSVTLNRFFCRRSFRLGMATRLTRAGELPVTSSRAQYASMLSVGLHSKSTTPWQRRDLASSSCMLGRLYTLIKPLGVSLCAFFPSGAKCATNDPSADHLNRLGTKWPGLSSLSPPRIAKLKGMVRSTLASFTSQNLQVDSPCAGGWKLHVSMYRSQGLKEMRLT
mmetsp:Transcript_3311/g.5714  ORF Transcript_3311/g.5714 Transcript_3311/m.5714 type:complete len:254 (-) Transcript_3311:123-884(-)